MYGLAVLKIRPVTGSFEAHPLTAKINNGSNILSFIVLTHGVVCEEGLRVDLVE